MKNLSCAGNKTEQSITSTTLDLTVVWSEHKMRISRTETKNKKNKIKYFVRTLKQKAADIWNTYNSRIHIHEIVHKMSHIYSLCLALPNNSFHYLFTMKTMT